MIFRVSCPRTSGRSSAKGKAHFAGPRFPGKPRTLRGRINWCWRCFRTTNTLRAGSSWRRNALSNTASGASWVSIHNGGGVGIGYSQHSGQVTVADGTKEMAKRIERVLTNDPGMGVVRHVDAGYPEAIAFAKKSGVKVPML